MKPSSSTKSQFTLYGLAQHNILNQTADAFAGIEKKADINNFTPSSAANKYYDKHII